MASLGAYPLSIRFHQNCIAAMASGESRLVRSAPCCKIQGRNSKVLVSSCLASRVIPYTPLSLLVSLAAQLVRSSQVLGGLVTSSPAAVAMSALIHRTMVLLPSG